MKEGRKEGRKEEERARGREEGRKGGWEDRMKEGRDGGGRPVSPRSLALRAGSSV